MYEISPLDGRYASKVEKVGLWFSEFSLMKHRIMVEAKYLLYLNKYKIVELNEKDIQNLNIVIENFSENHFQKIKEIENITKHDVKACELFLRDLVSCPHYVHFGITSEDVNNLAWGYIIQEFTQKEYLPTLQKLIKSLMEKAKIYKALPFPTRTHGQFATPTTLGKELINIAWRLQKKYDKISSHKIEGKFNGATGNFSAVSVAHPEIPWREFGKTFVESLHLQYNPWTIQIEPHDSWCELFGLIKQTQKQVQDMDVDFWLYISYGYFSQKISQGQVGSSTMPHKINPIRFENSEGNIEMSNAIFSRMEERFLTSRMQRDLTDSTLSRNIGVAFGHGILALQESLGGLESLIPLENVLQNELHSHFELLAEPVQTVLRKYKIENAYEIFREKTQGKSMNQKDFNDIIDSLGMLPIEVRENLKKLSPENYLGYAEILVDEYLEQYSF